MISCQIRTTLLVQPIVIKQFKHSNIAASIEEITSFVPKSSSFACICKSLRPRSILPGHGYEVVAEAVDVIEVVVVVTVVVVTS